MTDSARIRMATYSGLVASTVGEVLVECATCGLELPGAALAEHIRLFHIPNDWAVGDA